MGIGPSREAWWRKTHGKSVEGDVDAVRERLRAELAGRVWNRKDLDELHRTYASTIWQGAWIELVRVPPSGTWERRRADLFQLAEEWIGRADAGEEKGLEHLLRRYLGGFGPGTANEAANWAGVPVTKMKEAAERLSLRRFRDEEGKVLLDLPRAPLPGGIPAPVRFLPTWDATLLVHARRTRDPRGAVPSPHLQHEGAVFVPHVPRRRHGGRRLALGAHGREGDARRRAVRAAAARRRAGRARRGRAARQIRRAGRDLVCG